MDKSEAIKAGIRLGFQDGSSKMAQRMCYGYDHDTDGQLVINSGEAEVVRWIFERYLAGDSLGKIADGLAERNIASPTGNERWSRETLNKMLHNEKYTGDVLLQKSFVKDLFSGKQVKNDGKIERFLIQNHHPGIVSREVFEEARLSGKHQIKSP